MGRLVDYAVRLATAGLAAIALVAPYATVVSASGGSVSGSILDLVGAWRAAVSTPFSSSLRLPGILDFVAPETVVPLLGAWLAGVTFLVAGGVAAVVAPRAARWLLAASLAAVAGIVFLLGGADATVAPAAGLGVHVAAVALAVVLPRISWSVRGGDRPTADRQGAPVEADAEDDASETDTYGHEYGDGRD